MKLHRASARPDWAAVKQRNYTLWQRWAVATKGIATPGNVITLVGLVLVLLGLAALLRSNYWLGLGLLIVGRAADLLDGWLAQRTATKSPLGETLDAGADKIGTFLTIVVLGLSATAPWWAVVLLVLPHVAIAVVAVTLNKRGKRVHPSRLGKVSMAVAWLSLVGFVLVRAVGYTGDSAGQVVVCVLAVVSAGMGFVAALGYRRQSQTQE